MLIETMDKEADIPGRSAVTYMGEVWNIPVWLLHMPGSTEYRLLSERFMRFRYSDTHQVHGGGYLTLLTRGLDTVFWRAEGVINNGSILLEVGDLFVPDDPPVLGTSRWFKCAEWIARCFSRDDVLALLIGGRQYILVRVGATPLLKVNLLAEELAEEAR